MKIKEKILFLFIIFCVVFNAHSSCLAATNSNNETIDTSILSDNFTDELSPNQVNGAGEKISTPLVNFITKIVNSILGFIQIIGGILMVISVAMFGLGMLLNGNGDLARELGIGEQANGGSPDAKVALLNYGRTLLIGSVLLFSSASLVKFVFYILQGI